LEPKGSSAVKVEGLDNPDVQEAIVRGRVRSARVARLATTDPDGRPHLVPIVFVLDGQTLYSAVDASRSARAGFAASRTPASGPT
jgi:pyridoxamine 5'-phosphate oxidase-like protein